MHVGGQWVMIALAILTIFIIIRSNRRFKARKSEEDGDALFQTILATEDKAQCWELMRTYVGKQQQKFFQYAAAQYETITSAFLKENAGQLNKEDASLRRQKDVLKSDRRKETLCLRRLSRETAIEKSAWFHLSNTCCMGMLYNLRRINEICREHVDNNFHPLPQRYVGEFQAIQVEIGSMFTDVLAMMESASPEVVPLLRRRCDEIKDCLSVKYHRLFAHLREGNPTSMTVVYVYLNMLQETQELVSGIRKYLRAYAKLFDSDFSSRRHHAETHADVLPQTL